ncbi:MAG: Mur ligase family protein [Bacilli bacterium]
MKVILLGYGISTRSIEPFLQDDEIYIYDEKIIDDKRYISLSDIKERLPLFDLCIRSPGISSQSEIYLLMKYLCKEIISEIEFGLRRIKTSHIIAVTGSNGKTTLVSMIYHILKNKYRTFMLGNCGIPLTSKIENILEDDYVVLELSSFQLEDTYSLNFEIAIITNLEENHLNKVYSKDVYFASKLKLFNYNSKYKIYENNNKGLNVFQKSEQNYHIFDNSILNKHACTTIMVGKLLGLKEKEIINELSSFSIPKYRQEKIEKGAYLFVNDSKSTSVSATNACLEEFKNEKRIIILGGINKSGSFKNLKVNEDDIIYSFGKDGEEIQKEIGGLYFSSLEEVMLHIKIVKGAKIIIFSPGCSSFDQYINYKHRGEHFNRLIDLWF